MSNSHSMIQCAYCDRPQYNFSQYCRHLQLHHEFESNFVIFCHIPECTKKFKNVASYKKHNSRNHGTKVFFNVDSAQNSISLDAQPVVAEGIEESSELHEENVSKQHEHEEQTCYMNHFKKHFASFILNIKEKHLLADRVQETLISEMMNLVSCTEEFYKAKIRKGLDEVGVTPEESETLSDLLNDETAFGPEKIKLDTKYKIQKYIRKFFPFVGAREYFLSCHDDHSKYHYVPVPELLKTLIMREDLFEMIHRNKHSMHQQDVLYDTCDGRLSTLVDDDDLSITVKLHLYIDEFELCNPIGAKCGKYKLTAVYYSIGNMPVRYRIKSNMIFLCLLVRHKFIKAYDPTYHKLFEPLLADLLNLKSGINIDINGKEIQLKAVLEVVLGDNLSSHAIAGFQTHFNAGSICRYCTVNYNHFRKKTCTSELVERTDAIYANQIKYIDDDPVDAAVYGIKYKCVFSKLDYFSVPNAFPPDIMHDCLEGVVPNTIYEVLKALHSQQLITVADLNTSLSQVRIPTSDKPNVFPETFFTAGKITGSASQKLELLLILPQLLNLDAVVNSAAWDVYLKLRMCMDYILSPVLEKDSLPFLAGLIDSYIKEFKENFGEEKLIPKHHYMMHIPSLMEKFGPLRNLWCMNYERKHQYFKKLIVNTKNFINVTSTLTERHQMRLSYELSSKHFFSVESEAQSAIKNISFGTLPQTLRVTIQEKIGKPINDICVIPAVKSLHVDGISYIINSSVCYVLDFIKELPCFVQPKYILLLNER